MAKTMMAMRTARPASEPTTEPAIVAVDAGGLPPPSLSSPEVEPPPLPSSVPALPTIGTKPAASVVVESGKEVVEVGIRDEVEAMVVVLRDFELDDLDVLLDLSCVSDVVERFDERDAEDSVLFKAGTGYEVSLFQRLGRETTYLCCSVAGSPQRSAPPLGSLWVSKLIWICWGTCCLFVCFVCLWTGSIDLRR
jgi:hypothetical protein